MKKFNHIPVALAELSTEDRNGRRFYVTPEGIAYPSITTVLGAGNKDFLVAWRKRVGEEEAARITKHSTDLGTSVHAIAEKYLNNDPSFIEAAISPQAKHMFSALIPFLDRIDDIRIQEAPLYSDTLKIAGRTDCIASFDGVPAIVDFKTARKEKKAEWINDYFLQGTFYSLAFEERTGIKIPNIVILMTTQDYKPFIFKVKRKDYYASLAKIMKENLPKVTV